MSTPTPPRSSNASPEVSTQQSVSAALPPRKNPTPTRISRQHLTPLQTLLQLGFPRARAEKALVATGNRGVQLASDWLLAHVNDPTVDEEQPRTFMVYLCPTGRLQDQLQTFWDASRTQIGWNGAHQSFPHISLCSPFACPDAHVQNLLIAVAKVASDFGQDFKGEQLRLERYQSANFLGFFLGKKEEILLRSFCQSLSEEVGTATGISIDPVSKSYHLTLAFQFAPQHFAGLEDLAASVDSSSACDWELRLYSSEERIKGNGVHKVIYAHVPRQEDELELLIGDLVYVSPDEIKSSTDGWVLGTSWLTGNQGYIPKNYVQQTADTNAWTLHQSIPLTKESPLKMEASYERLKGASSLLSLGSAGDGAAASGAGENQHPTSQGTEKMKSSKSTTSLGSTSSHSEPRRIFICRHGERVDFTFGSWIPFCFDESGRYTQKDLNMPASLPVRSLGPEAYLRDSPLTSVGIVQARLTGEAMLAAGATVSHAFASPSFRCVQTCYNILVGLGLHRDIKINLEPGLFEWLVWHQNSIPDCMTPEELQRAGYNVDETYKPYIAADELQDTEESCEAYYSRNFLVVQCVLTKMERSGGNILFVGHAATLDACTRQLSGHQPRPAGEMLGMLRKVPYCSMVAAQEELVVATHSTPSKGDRQLQQKKKQWRVTEPPVPPMTHCSNARFDWKILLESSEGQK